MAELSVSRKTIGKLLGDMQGRMFIIPDFQRPYKWDEEKCETLWNDIENFALTEAKAGAEYFLGTIVSYINARKNQEVIDGQQRLTSFFLLLRAFYKKLEGMPEDEDVIGLKNQVAPCIWDINPISQKVTDKTVIHIQSQVATEEDNEVFHGILQSGETDDSRSDNYSINYRFFKKCCDNYATEHPMQWKQLCITILQQCIILPIECDTPETALTIFSTLNDRGMPLSDSDIFKAQLYRNFEHEEDRRNFTEDWKVLTQVCAGAFMDIDDVFRYYSHVIRARNGDRSKEIGLRRFYAHDSYARLKAPELMEEVMSLADFWSAVNTGEDPDGDTPFTLSFNSRKYFHCLVNYPNEYWKYITSVFFLKNRGSNSFDDDLVEFLANLVAFLFAKFIEKPSVNAIKDDIYSGNIAIQNNSEIVFRYAYVEENLSEWIVDYYRSKIARALLLLHAYLNPEQTSLIPRFDIEHIFPKRWQDTNYNGWNIEDAWDYLDRFGNKVVLERKINIQAGNGYFGVKQARYISSSIASVIDLANYPKPDWLKEDIELREEQFVRDIMGFFREYLG
ncbi:MAG: DUF262 domain-containing HNH endonuclease family protein [Cytophagales bacterium]|nr:DUF262 domain-containing HNH endonuclease family protein [Cytophagales bacterium]